MNYEYTGGTRKGGIVYMKKSFCLFLALALCICAFSFTVASGVDYLTYNLKLTDNGDGTATVTVTLPAGVSSGKIVVKVSDKLAYIENSLTSGTVDGTINPNYNVDGVTGLCVAYATSGYFDADTTVFTAKYTIVDGGFVSLEDVSVPVWNLSNGDVKLGTQLDGDVAETYTPAYYIVKFVGLNDAILKEYSVERGQAANAPPVPHPEGYIFQGWDRSFNSIMEDTTVNALLERISYTVTFIGMNDYVISIQPVYHGEGANVPSAPAVVGYTFVEWDTDTSVVKADTIVKAVYNKKEYTVEFLGLNDKVISTQTVKFGESAIAPEAPEEEGYNFDGWDDEFDNITGNKTVKAKYSLKEYQVTFEADGGGVLDGNTFVKVTHGTAIADVLHPTPVADEGFRFVGWDITEGVVTGEITIVAHFEKDYILGDVNADGYVDNLDAAKILRYDAGMLEFNATELIVADVNLDGEANNIDAALILKLDAGLIEGF